MPPEGYTTVTVPEELLERLEGYQTEARVGEPHWRTIEWLMDAVDAGEDEANPATAADIRRLEELVERIPERTVDRLHTELR